MKQTKYLKTNKLYILSGPSASGKTTFVNKLIKNHNIGLDCIVSSDKIRKDILGIEPSLDSNGFFDNLYGWEIQNQKIFDIIYSIVDIRCKEKLLTFIDSTCLNDKTRSEFVKIAQKNGFDFEILAFNNPIEVLEERLKNRKERFPSSVIHNQLSKYSLESVYPLQIINENEFEYKIQPNLINTTNLDIVGDIHGLYDSLVFLLEKAGWTIKNDKLEHSDPNRKILFLGDCLDRGEQSLEVLNLIHNSVQDKTAFFILGNHEHKILRTLKNFIQDGILKTNSLAINDTIAKIINKGSQYVEKVYLFLLSSPSQLTIWLDENKEITFENPYYKFGFVHANIEHFNPYGIPATIAIYGKKNSNSDFKYSLNFENQINNHLLIRGHAPTNHSSDNIFSLDNKQAFNGELLLLPFDKFLKTSMTNHDFYNLTLKQKTMFHFEEHLLNTKNFFMSLKELEKQKKITCYIDNGLLKFTNSNNNIDAQFNILKNLYFDFAGNIVQNSFPYIPLINNNNYEILKKLDSLTLIQKINGETFTVSKHPFKDDLLITNENNSDILISYFNKNIKEKETIINFLQKNKCTLLLKTNQEKIFLIAAKSNNSIEDLLKTEEYLDIIKEEKLPFLERSKYFKSNYLEVLDLIEHDENRGYLVKDSNNHPILNFYTKKYLINHFIKHTQTELLKFLFSNPEEFTKQNTFYSSIVEVLIKKTNYHNFLQQSDKDKFDFLLENISFFNENKHISKKP